ncbi:MAG: carboxypeptidase regulatory-like domain-containing protein [Bryobacteraceae bacterium]
MSHRAALLVLVLASFSASLFGQSSRGTVTGIVTDASKAVLANAAVELSNTQTKVVRSTNTNEAGLYRFDAVDPGSYTIRVTASGFKASLTQPFDVVASQIASVDSQLELGQVTSTVEVSAAAALIQTEAPVRGGTITTQNIIELPIASQNPVSLALTLPGVSTNRYSFGVGTFSVNGGRGRSNNFLIDGTENNDISVTGQAFQITNPDAVQEVSVQTGNYDAEYGRAGGGVVNVITQNGTNAFHGTARYLLESTIVDAPTNLQKTSPAVLQRGHPLPGTDQFFAGTLGGPIKRNKTFFFSAYQEERRNSTSQSGLTTLSPAGRATLASLFPNGTNPRADLLRQITAGADANSQFFNVSAGPGRPDIQFGTYQRPIPTPVLDRQLIERVDHNFSTNDQLSGRYMLDYGQQTVGGSTGFFGFDTAYQPKVQNVLANETHTFSPAATNELRLAYNRIVFFFPATASDPLAATLPQITIAGATGASILGIPSNIPQGRIANNYELQDTANYVHGNHSFRFGTSLLDQRSKQAAPFNGRGTLSYQASTGYTGLANFLDNFGGSSGGAARDFGSPTYYPSLFRQAYFAQDRWRVTDALTLTLGVRYEYFGVPINSIKTPAFTGLFNIDPKTFTGPYSQPDAVKSDKNNFAPTIGIAYAPSFDSGILGKLFGVKKSVFRTGYQIGYDSFFNNIASNALASSPNLVSTNAPSVVDVNNPRGLANVSGAFPSVARPLSPLDSQTLVLANLVNPYYQRWSAGIERELPGHMVLDASYVGSKGTRLFINEDLNPLVTASLRNYPAGYTAASFLPSQIQGRLDPLQGSRLIRTNGGSSNYEAFQLEVRRQFSNGLTFKLAYTRSKFIDNSSDVFASGGNNLPQQTQIPSIFGGLKNDRSVSLYDRPNRMAFTYVYQLPFLREQHGLVGHVAGGWEISGVTVVESGAPLNILNGQDADGLGGGVYDRPNFNPLGRPGVRAVPNSSSPTGYVNPDDLASATTPISPTDAMYIGLPACLSTTTPCPSGNLGRFTLRTPRIDNFDASLNKSISITERVHLQFRMEVYNVFNHRQYGVQAISPFDSGTTTISANVFTSPAGRFLNPGFADGGARVIRYQLKFVF